MSNLWGNFMWTGWKNLTFFMSNLFRCNWVVSSLLMKHGRTYNHSSDFKRVKRSVRQQDWQHVVLWCIPGGNKCWFCFTFFSNSWFLFEIEGNYVGVSKNAIFFLTCLSKTIITIFFYFEKSRNSQIEYFLLVKASFDCVFLDFSVQGESSDFPLFQQNPANLENIQSYSHHSHTYWFG